jgi:hypothetical protein
MREKEENMHMLSIIFWAFVSGAGFSIAFWSFFKRE